MTDLEMLEKDIEAMSYEEALNYLRFDLDMMLFDPSTGETDSLHYLKHCTNEDNYPTYVAISKCIKLLENITSEIKALKEL